MEMKDLLKIEKLRTKDKVMSIMIVIGIIVFVLILIGNSRTSKKVTTKNPEKTVAQKDIQSTTVPKKDNKKTAAVTSGMNEIIIGAGREDPFLPPTTKGKGKIYTTGFRLEGVTMDSEGRPMAIINDEIIGVGGIIGGDKVIGRGEVISIEKDEVIIKKGDEKFVLKLWSDQALR